MWCIILLMKLIQCLGAYFVHICEKIHCFLSCNFIIVVIISVHTFSEYFNLGTARHVERRVFGNDDCIYLLLFQHAV